MNKVWIGWIAALALSLAAGMANQHIFEVKPILPIQFATSARSIDSLICTIAPTKAESYHRLLRNTELDYLYLLGYILLSLFSVTIVLRALEIRPKRGLYVLAVIPGIMDAIENAFLLATATHERPEIFWLYIAVVRIKWAVSIVPFMVIPMILIYGLVIALRSRQGSKPPATGKVLTGAIPAPNS